MALYSIRSQRAFCERLNYDLLFERLPDLPFDAKAFDATTFTKIRLRLLDHDIADRFFEAVVAQAKLRRDVSSQGGPRRAPPAPRQGPPEATTHDPLDPVPPDDRVRLKPTDQPAPASTSRSSTPGHLSDSSGRGMPRLVVSLSRRRDAGGAPDCE